MINILKNWNYQDKKLQNPNIYAFFNIFYITKFKKLFDRMSYFINSKLIETV
jgi:hypothetical protein